MSDIILLEVRSGNVEITNKPDISIYRIDWDEVVDDFYAALELLEAINNDKIPSSQVERVKNTLLEIWPNIENVDVTL